MSAAEPRPDSTTEQSSKTSSEPELSQDEVFHLLQTPRRRYVLQYLKEHEGPVEMRDVAEQVAAWENNTTVAALSSDERQRVYIPLYQSHLPKLDEEGVVDYDQDRGTVARTELANQFDQYLNVAEGTTTNIDDAPSSDHKHSWALYYLSISLIGTLLLGGVAAGLPIIGSLPPLAIGGLVVTAFLVVTLAQTYLGQSE